MKRLYIEALSNAALTNACVCMEGFTTVARSKQVQTYNYTHTHTHTIHTSTTRVFESHWTGKKVIRARLWTWQGRERERRALKQKNWWLTKLPKTPLLPSRLTGNGMFSFFSLSLLYREKSSFDSAGVMRRVSVCVQDRRLPAAAGVRGLIRWGLLTMRYRGVCVCVCLCIAQIRGFQSFRWHGPQIWSSSP